MADAVLTLFQAEWCPFSSAVREVLTELGVDFVARQVEPWPEQREKLRAEAGTDQIPVLRTGAGETFRGTREIYTYLRGLDAGEHAAAHRQRFGDHQPARESDAVAQLLGYFEPPPAPGTVPEAGELEFVDVPDRSRYELRAGGRPVGIAAYRRRDGNLAFTHTEVEEGLEGHGVGSRLAAAALDDARRQELDVVPLCPFIARYIDRHPEYQDLVAARYGSR